MIHTVGPTSATLGHTSGEAVTTTDTDDRSQVVVDRVDAGDLRRMIARIPAPVTIVAAYSEHGPVGFTASSFVNISVDPPLVGFFVAESARSFEHFERVDRVAINVLADHQSELASVFAGKSEDKFAGIELDPTIPTAPVVTEAMGAIVGSVHARGMVGDHLMVTVQVDSVVRRSHAPLVYQDRTFRVLTDLLS